MSIAATPSYQLQRTAFVLAGGLVSGSVRASQLVAPTLGSAHTGLGGDVVVAPEDGRTVLLHVPAGIATLGRSQGAAELSSPRGGRESRFGLRGTSDVEAETTQESQHDGEGRADVLTFWTDTGRWCRCSSTEFRGIEFGRRRARSYQPRTVAGAGSVLDHPTTPSRSRCT